MPPPPIDATIGNEDPHAVLNLPRTATPREAKERYATLARVFHPDKVGAGASEDDFRRVERAYKTLSDPVASFAHGHGGAGALEILRADPELRGRLARSLEHDGDGARAALDEEMFAARSARQEGLLSGGARGVSVLAGNAEMRLSAVPLLSALANGGGASSAGPDGCSVSLSAGIPLYGIAGTSRPAASSLTLGARSHSSRGFGGGALNASLRHDHYGGTYVLSSQIGDTLARGSMGWSAAATRTLAGGTVVSCGLSLVPRDEAGDKPPLGLSLSTQRVVRVANRKIFAGLSTELGPSPEWRAFASGRPRGDLSAEADASLGGSAGLGCGLRLSRPLPAPDGPGDGTPPGHVSASVRADAASGPHASFRISRPLSPFASATVGARFGGGGVKCLFGVRRGDVSFRLPLEIMAVGVNPTAMLLACALCTVVDDILADWSGRRRRLLYGPRKEGAEEERDHGEKGRERWTEALAQQKRMERIALSKRTKEEQSNGLVIISATYSAGTGDHSILDVTVPAQFWTNEGSLWMPPGRRGGLLGFCDVGTNERRQRSAERTATLGLFRFHWVRTAFRQWQATTASTDDEVSAMVEAPVLHVRYRLGGKVYEASVRDDEAVYISPSSPVLAGGTVVGDANVVLA